MWSDDHDSDGYEYDEYDEFDEHLPGPAAHVQPPAPQVATSSKKNPTQALDELQIEPNGTLLAE